MPAHPFMRLIAVSVATAAPLKVPASGGEAHVMSGIRKRPVSTLSSPMPIAVAPLGVAGDEQADLTVHGGLDKAVYAYPSEHYPWWRAQREQAGLADAGPLADWGALGENLTWEGILEADLWVGDTIRIGEVVLRVESPRQPCYKFNAVMGYSRAARHMLESGYSGVYMSVVTPGQLRAGDAIVVEPGPRDVAIAAVNSHRRHKRDAP